MDEAFKKWEPWIFHQPNCRVVGIGWRLHDKCTCGLSEMLKAINATDPRENGE